jgi:hypothetical protein
MNNINNKERIIFVRLDFYVTSLEKGVGWQWHIKESLH